MNTHQTADSSFLSLDNTEESPPQSATWIPLQLVVQKVEDLSSLSDAELQSYILFCAEKCNAAHDRYKATGCFSDAGERDAWWSAEAAALVERGSRPEVVARLERERGLA